MAQLASTIIMSEPSQDISAFLHCLSGTALPFAFSSLAAVLVAVSIAILGRQTALRHWLPLVIGAHLTPLLVAPVLFANLLTTYVESELHLITWSQSNQFLAFCGFIFHSFLAYVVLERVFLWTNRVRHAEQLAFNNSRGSVTYAIYALQLGPPLIFTLAMLFVFQESMISVPLFTQTHTVLSLAQRIIQNSGSLTYSWIIAVILIVAAVVFLAISYHIPKLVARWALILLARRSHSGVSVQKTVPRFFRALFRVSTIACAFIVVISALVHSIAFAVVVMRLFTLSGEADLTMTGPAWASLATPALKCGVFVFLGWMITALISTRRVSSQDFRLWQGLALAPPALIGTMGLLFVWNPISQVVVAYMFLFAYSYLLFRFFISDTELAADRIMLHNAKILKLQFSRQSLVVLLSAIGGVFGSALLAFYFLWIEDGVQVTILTNGSNLANLVRGLRQDKLLSSTYYGVMAIFIAWLVVTIVVLSMTRYRYHFFASRLRKILPTTPIILATVLVFSTNTVGQSTKQNSSVDAADKCVNKAVVISDRGEFKITSAGCAVVRIEEVTLDGNIGSLNLTASQATIEISKLNILKPGATFYVKGIVGQPVRELSIRSIVLPLVAPIDIPRIEFRDTEIGRLTVNGYDLNNANTQPFPARPKVNLTMGDSSSAETIEIHELTSPELSLRLTGKGKDSVHFEQVETAFLRITSLSTHAGGANIDGVVTLEGRPGQQPSMSIDNLRARNIRMSIDGASGGDINLKNIEMDPRANAEFQLVKAKGNVNIHVEDVALGGRMQIQAPESEASFNLTMYGLTRSARPGKSYPTVVVRIRNLSKLTLKELDIDDLDLCGSSINNADGDNVVLQNISVVGILVTPKIIESLSQGSRDLDRVRFLRTLQERGRYCDTKEIIGTNALYSRKRAELLSLHPSLGWVIDRMTGLGIEMQKPFVTFLVVLGFYILIRVILLFWDNRLKLAADKRAPVRIISEALLGGFFIPIVPVQHFPRIEGALKNIRLVFGWFVFTQITLCSIYLGQTTLQ